jgi:hypothetical protein
MDITYIPMARGFVYLAVVLDWATRRVLACKSGEGSHLYRRPLFGASARNGGCTWCDLYVVMR